MTWRSSISARKDDSTRGISPTNKQKLKNCFTSVIDQQTKNKQRNVSLGAQIADYFLSFF
jgi:hypothetical protein